MIQLVAGLAAGYVMGTKAGRKRYHQIKRATQAAVNSPVTKKAVGVARKTLAEKLDPTPRMRELKNVRTADGHQILEQDED